MKRIGFISLLLLGLLLFTAQSVHAAPQTGRYNYGEAFQKALYFYDIARSGPIPPGYRVEWKANSAMNDGKDIRPDLDLTGGWYDAGDHVKFGLPMAYSATMLAWGAVEYRSAYESSGQMPYLLENLHVVNDYFIRAHDQGDPLYPNVLYGQVGNGPIDHAWWGAPEVMQMVRPAYKIDSTCPGSDLAGQTAAAMAAASIVFKPTEPQYAATLVQHARELYSFADNYRGKYDSCITDAGGFYASGGYNDELVWGAMWLYLATQEQSYLDKAENYARQFGFIGQTLIWTQAWDDSRYGALLLLARHAGDADIVSTVENWLNYWTVGNSSGGRIPYTPGGLAYLNSWGVLRYAATSAFLALIYADHTPDQTLKDRYRQFAVNQINYALGDNPLNRSYMVGFGKNPPTHPHHRGSHGSWENSVDIPDQPRHMLYGALVGGPDDDDSYVDVRSDYVHNEVATDYNAGVTGALARLYELYGGDPLQNFPPPEVKDDEIFVQARYGQQTAKSVVIFANLYNRSAWPARQSTNYSFRYFVDLSETYAAGFTVNDLTTFTDYCEQCTISGFKPWDEAKHIYYIEIAFPNTLVYPGGTVQHRRQSQFYIGFPYVSSPPANAFDPMNDPSFVGIGSGTEMKTTYTISVYDHDQKIAGTEPGGGGCVKTTGDANCDGDVSVIDFGYWMQEMVNQTVGKPADFNNDGSTTIADFFIWVNHAY